MDRFEVIKILRRIHEKVPCKRSKLVVKEEIEKLEEQERIETAGADPSYPAFFLNDREEAEWKKANKWTGPSSTGDNRG